MLRLTGTMTPKPKIHKSDLYVLSVLDMNNSACHTIAKWLVEIPKLLNIEIVKYSESKITSWYHKMYRPYSLMFLYLKLDFIFGEIMKMSIETLTPVSAIKQLVLRCKMNVHFRFNNEYYRQLSGVAMVGKLCSCKTAKWTTLVWNQSSNILLSLYR